MTHCQTGRSQYEQYVLQEYLIYRVYNLLSDMSFTGTTRAHHLHRHRR